MTNKDFVEGFFKKLSDNDINGALGSMNEGATVTTWEASMDKAAFKQHLSKQDTPRVIKATIVHDEGDRLDADVDFGQQYGIWRYRVELDKGGIQKIRNRMADFGGGTGAWPPSR